MDATELSAVVSNSLSLGSILTLTALGLAITFGVMRVINMAHGEMLMLGAYSALLVTDTRYLGRFLFANPGFTGPAPLFNLGLNPDFSLFLAIPVAFLLVAGVGYLLEVILIRHLYGRPLDTLLATWGVGMILQQAVLLRFGANLQPMRTPDVLSGSVAMGDVTIPAYRLFIVGITLVSLLAVYLWFFKTSFGLKVRAVVQNRPMAAALGISTRKVDSLTFAFASGLAGVAGCILAHLYNVKYNMGTDYIVTAFMVVIMGGAGQLSGSVAGGGMVGTGESVTVKLLGSSGARDLAGGVGITAGTWDRVIVQNGESLAQVFVLLLIIGFILIRPSGLFATRERSYD
jgi:urea transport system permease protein